MIDVSVLWVAFAVWYVLSGIGIAKLWRNSIRSDAPVFGTIIIWPMLVIFPALFSFDTLKN